MKSRKLKKISFLGGGWKSDVNLNLLLALYAYHFMPITSCLLSFESLRTNISTKAATASFSVIKEPNLKMS